MADGGINFGILQPQPTPQVQVMQRPNYAAQNAQMLQSGINSAASNFNAMQEGQRQKALLPGQIQAQSDAHNTSLLSQQQGQMAVQSAQFQMQQRQERIQAYNDAAAKGGPEAGLDAVQGKLYASGDDTLIKAGLDMGKARDDLKNNIATHNREGIVAISSNVIGTMKEATPDTVDPQTGQTIPGKKPLDIYTQQYPMIKKQYPDAPDPSTFKGDNTIYEDTFVHPVLDTSKNYIQQEKAKQDELNKNKMYQAQNLVDDNTQALKTAVKQYGPTSQEATDAANALQQAQREATRQSFGGENGSIGTIQNYMNSPASKGQLIQRYSPQAGQPAPGQPVQGQPAQPGMPPQGQPQPQQGQAPQMQGQPQTPPAAPQLAPGRVMVKAPDGTMGSIPQEQLQAAIQAGYVQGK